MSSSSWYIVQVISGRERKVKRCIDETMDARKMREHIEECFLPIENVIEIKKGERKISEKKLWPGYLFFKMKLDDASWSFVNGVDGVIGFLGGNNPKPMTEVEINDIISNLKNMTEEVVHKVDFEVNDTVKIVDGVFASFSGTVVEVVPDKGKLSVSVSIFGRETKVDDLEFWQVEKSDIK